MHFAPVRRVACGSAAFSESRRYTHDTVKYGDDPVTGYIPESVSKQRVEAAELASLSPECRLRKIMVRTGHFNPDAVEDLGLNVKEEYEQWKRGVDALRREQWVSFFFPWFCLFAGLGVFVVLAFYGFH